MEPAISCKRYNNTEKRHFPHNQTKTTRSSTVPFGLNQHYIVPSTLFMFPNSPYLVDQINESDQRHPALTRFGPGGKSQFSDRQLQTSDRRDMSPQNVAPKFP